MAQSNVQTARGTSFAAIESQYGVEAGSLVPIFPVSQAMEGTFEQEHLEDMTESARLMDTKARVHGLKSGGASFKTLVRAAGTKLTSLASPATPWLGTLLKAVMGGEYKAAGSLVVTAASSSVEVSAGHGSRFLPGQVICVETGDGAELCIVTAVSTDTLTVWPNLDGSGVVGGFVLGGYHYFYTETNEQTLTVEHAINDSVQWKFFGCTGDVAFSTERSGLVEADFSLTAATWDTETLGISTSVQTNDMTAPFAVKDVILYLQDAATASRTQVSPESVSVQLSGGMERIPALDGVEGTNGVMRTGGRDMVTFTIKMREDDARRTDWKNQDLQRLLVAFPKGSTAATKRFLAISARSGEIVGRPKPIREGGRLLTEITIKARIDATATADTISGAPAVVSLL